MSLNQQEIANVRYARNEGWDEGLRYEYPLNIESKVWDLGGWIGDFAEKMFLRYSCTVDVFEMMPQPIIDLETRFATVGKVIIHHYGLSNQYKQISVKNDNDCTSSLISGTDPVTLHDIRDEWRGPIDLLKINIEGEEYEVLDALYTSNYLAEARFVQVQFHDYLLLNGVYLEVPNAQDRYDEAVRQLSETHTLQWSWPWVWESWERK